MTFNGEQIPDGVCKYAYLGMRCPFLNDPEKTCSFRHDVKKGKPAAPAPVPKQNGTPSEAPQSQAPTSQPQPQQRSANSPARTNPDEF